MYDAVNRGLRRANGEIFAYLNCDEQYLPGALSAVERFFAARPEVDVAFADAVVVDSRGEYVCERRALLPQRAHSHVSGNLAFLTCATFFRRRILDGEKRTLLDSAPWWAGRFRALVILHFRLR